MIVTWKIFFVKLNDVPTDLNVSETNVRTNNKSWVWWMKFKEATSKGAL